MIPEAGDYGKARGEGEEPHGDCKASDPKDKVEKSSRDLLLKFNVITEVTIIHPPNIRPVV